MALNGILGSFPSGGESGPINETASGAHVPDETLAVALAADQIKDDPRLAHATGAFLEEHTLLLQSQREEIAESRGLRTAYLRGQIRESRMRYVGYRLRAFTLGVTSLILSVIGSGLVVMIYDAFTSHSVIVDTFTAPPALTARGVTGEFVASSVLDALRKLQVATKTATVGMEARGAWANDIKIEVPKTGISIGEISRLLHTELGHDMHIDGDLTEGPTGELSLTVRGPSVSGSTFVGGPTDLVILTTRAAEYIYGRVQPWGYSAFLVDAGRDRDAIAFLPGALSRVTDNAERANLFNIWGDALPDPRDGAAEAEKYRLAMALSRPRSPLWWNAWGNLVGAIMASGGEEAAWRESETFSKAAADTPKRERPEVAQMGNPSQVMWDPPLLLRSLIANLPQNDDKLTSPATPEIAVTEGLLHDPQQAALYAAMSDPNDDMSRAEVSFLQGSTALARGDAAAAIAPLQAFDRVWLANPELRSDEPDQPCFLGLAYGLSGDLAKAVQAFDQVPEPWSRCYAFRGDVLAHAGDVAGAQRVWAEGIRLLPDLPNVFLARGQWELKQGDPGAALADLSASSRKAPHFADPLKAWGDLLAREGRWNEAESKYHTALADAPHWTALREAQAVALGHGPDRR